MASLRSLLRQANGPEAPIELEFVRKQREKDAQKAHEARVEAVELLLPVTLVSINLQKLSQLTTT